MAAAATVRKSPPRRAAGRRPATSRNQASRSAPKRRPQHTPIPGRLVPLAVGRTAIAVGGLADSGLVLRLTRGRLWIGALATLLVGIVGLNVMALSLNASSSKTAGAGDTLKRQNSTLNARLAEQLSNERVQRAADDLGLVIPEPSSLRFLHPSPGDAAEAARRLRSGDLGPGTGYVAPAIDAAAVAPTSTEPAATDETEAAPPAEITADAAAPPAAEAASPDAGGGGVASP
jgi:hypothetical protein